FARVALAAMLAVTAGWAWVLLGRSPGWYPWLRAAIVAAGLVAAVAILARPGPAAATAGRWETAVTGRGRTFLATVPVSLAMIAGLGGPLAYSISTAATAHTGALPSAGPATALAFGPGRFRGGTGGQFSGAGGFGTGPVRTGRPGFRNGSAGGQAGT